MENKKKKPPRIAEWLLLRFANKGSNSAIIGDFAEEFSERAVSDGAIRARLWYWLLIAVSFPSFIKNICYWSFIMFKNYFRVALRNLKRHKGFSFINIAGLAIGIACSVLMAMFVLYELSFDKHHEKYDRIYRVGAQFGTTVDDRGAFTAPPMAKALMEDFPEIEQAVRFMPWQTTYSIRFAEKRFLEKGLKAADAGLFQIFTIPFIHGDPKTALKEPKTIVITQAIAKKYFGEINPLGKSLRLEDRKTDFIVTGVVENCPATSHFQFEMIASLSSLRGSFDRTWRSHRYFTYILLREDTTVSQLEAKLPKFVKKYYGAQIFRQTGQTFENYLKDHFYGFFLQPLSEIHWKSSVIDQFSVSRSKVYIYVFITIAVFILLIACINFMNLSTARFAHRSKEVGMRKVLGSSKKQLVIQFMGESILLSLFALAVALIFIQIILPVFNLLARIQINLNFLEKFYLLPILIGFSLLVGILAGSYPAFFLSSFQPVRTIKGTLGRRANSHMILRRTLVILQFSITFAIFLGTFIIYKQLDYVRKRDLGFDKEQVLVIRRAYNLGSKGEAFKQELLRYPQIVTISDSESLPGRHFDPNGHTLEGRPKTEEETIMTTYADHEFLDLLDLKLAEGRYFSKEIPTDATSAVVINEAAVKKLGITDPIGKRFHKEFRRTKKGEFVTIIGVLKDIHFMSLHWEILPMLIRPLSKAEWNLTSIKIRPEHIRETVELVEKTWNKYSGGQPFQYSFLDSDFDNLYRYEERTAQILAYFSGLAIFIACLGLFGLVSFAAEQRTKEIGIRKVLGASVSRIIYLLSREVMILVVISACIASPAAFFGMKKWLRNFAYRIDLGLAVFVLTALAILAVALLSVSFRTLKAARENPADTLKYE
jgi:putative ABC transport system permease protein